MMWRVLPYHEQTACMNMATDEAILEAISRKESPPTIRFYGWHPSAITIGNFQCRGDEVDMQVAKSRGIEVVRRLTGGGAVYHDQKGEITYSILGPVDLFPTNIGESYSQICGHVVEALNSLGLSASFRPINDVIVDQRKISGSAQTRRQGVLLQHGTILIDVDVQNMFCLLTVDQVKISDKYISSVKKAVTSIHEQKGEITREDVLNAMISAFTHQRSVMYQNLSPKEEMRSRELATKKYNTEEWNDLRK